MKKRILLILSIAAMLICIVAVSVSASERTAISYTDINGVVHSVPVVKYEDVTAEAVASAIKAGDSRSHSCSVSATTRIMDDGSYAIVMDSNGELTAYPSWYIIDATGDSSYAEVYEIGYGYLNSVSGKTYKDGAIRYIEFPQGMTAMRANSVFGGSNTKYEINVTEVHVPKTVLEVRGGSFAQAPSLQYFYIEEGSLMNKIQDESFSECPNLLMVEFENLSLLTLIDGFRGCGKLACDLDLSKCTALKDIGSKAFYKTDIRKITLPNSVEKIDNDAFAYCPNGYLSSPYLPTSLKTVGAMFFSYNNNLLDTYIFPEGVTSIGNEPFQDSKVAGGPNGKELNLVFLGKVTGVIYVNGNGHQKHADKVTVYFAQNSLSEYNKNGFYIKPSGSSVTNIPNAINAVFCSGNGVVELSYITSTSGASYTEDMANDADYGFDLEGHRHFGKLAVENQTCGKDGSETVSCIICDTNVVTILEATGNHSYENGTCTVCGNVLCPGGIGHNMVIEVVYANGFTGGGVVANKCQNEGCTYEIKISDMEALFTCLGYSAPEDGSGGMAIGYTINNEAIAEYERITGKTLNYGVFAVTKDKLGANDVFGNDGASSGVIAAEISNCNFVAVQLKITGFTDAQKDKKLAMGAYVAIIDGDTTEYSYIQYGTPSEGEKYCFVSYNDIVPPAPSEKEEVAE